MIDLADRTGVITEAVLDAREAYRVMRRGLARRPPATGHDGKTLSVSTPWGRRTRATICSQMHVSRLLRRAVKRLDLAAAA